MSDTGRPRDDDFLEDDPRDDGPKEEGEPEDRFDVRDDREDRDVPDDSDDRDDRYDDEDDYDRAPRSRYGDRNRRVRYFSLDVGHVIGSTFSIWIRNLIPFFLMAVLVNIPLIVFLWLFFDTRPSEETADLVVSFAVLFQAFVLTFILTGAVTYGAVQQLRGNPAGIGQCLSVGVSRIIPVLGVSLIVGIATIAGLILLVIPGLILMCVWYVAVPATVLERKGPFGAMGRSHELTSGHKPTIFGIAFIMGILLMLMQMPFGFLEIGDELTTLLVQQVIHLFFIPLPSILQAVVYHDLRVGKEGADISDLASVFD
jgi:hypothetical protein